MSYVISEERNQAVFLGDDLQSPGSDKVYQLWTIQGQDPTSQGLVTGSGSVTHWFDAPVDGAQVMAVTVEPAGGSPLAHDHSAGGRRALSRGRLAP